jgi:hypothetical protein
MVMKKNFTVRTETQLSGAKPCTNYILSENVLHVHKILHLMFAGALDLVCG